MIFLDTNILVYAVDFRDPAKQKIAERIIENALSGNGEYAIAVQTLTEFVNVSLLKLKKTAEETMELLQVYMDIPTFAPDAEMVSRGLVIKNEYGIQFYDAMMLAAADKAKADVFFTEDLNDGQFYSGVKAVNPFILSNEVSFSTAPW